MMLSKSGFRERVFSTGFAQTPLLSKTFVLAFGGTMDGFEIKVQSAVCKWRSVALEMSFVAS